MVVRLLKLFKNDAKSSWFKSHPAVKKKKVKSLDERKASASMDKIQLETGQVSTMLPARLPLSKSAGMVTILSDDGGGTVNCKVNRSLVFVRPSTSRTTWASMLSQMISNP